MNACSDTCLASCLAGLLSRIIIRKFLFYVSDLHISPALLSKT